MVRKLGAFEGMSALAIVFATIALGGIAQAQADEEENRSASAMEEVVVTAERRLENLQTTALSATVLSAELLADKGVMGLTAVQYAAPGVLIADYSSANTFNIRGIGQARVDIDIPSGVVIYRDGVPTLTGYFQNAPYYDMAGIEVLRGPQGTFAGKAAAAGAVFIRTADPTLDGFNGKVMAGAGNRSFWEGTAVLNMPVSETFAIRLSGHLERRDSLFDHIYTNPLPGGENAAGPYHGDDDRYLNSVRLGMLWKPNDQFGALFKIDYDYLYFGNHATTGLDPLTGAVEDIRNPIVNGDHRYRDKGTRASLKLTYDFENGISFASLSGFSTVDTRANWDVNGADPAPFGVRSHGDFTNYSQEFDLRSPDDQRFRWVVGAFYQFYKSNIPNYEKGGIGFDLDSGTRFDYTTSWKKEETSLAAFGQIEYDLTQQLTMQLGVRYNRYRFSQFTNWAVDFSSIILGIEGDLFYIQNGGAGQWQYLNEQSTDWKANLNYAMTDDHFLYALISRGHTPGSINLIADSVFTTPELPPYKEMEVINYEVGWKGSFFNDQLRTQWDAYYQTFKNYQADFALVGPDVLPNATIFQNRNALTKSKIYGSELGAQAHVGDFELDFGVAYIDSELGSFGITPDPFARMYGGPSEVNLAGAHTPFSPKWTANGGMAYTFHAGNGVSGQPLTITPRFDLAYRDDTYARLFQNPATKLEGFTLLNAQISVDSGPWSLVFWGTNLTDKKYVAAKQNVDTSPPSATIPYDHFVGIVYGGLRRLYGVRLTREF